MLSELNINAKCIRQKIRIIIQAVTIDFLSHVSGKKFHENTKEFKEHRPNDLYFKIMKKKRI